MNREGKKRVGFNLNGREEEGRRESQSICLSKRGGSANNRKGEGKGGMCPSFIMRGRGGGEGGTGNFTSKLWGGRGKNKEGASAMKERLFPSIKSAPPTSRKGLRNRIRAKGGGPIPNTIIGGRGGGEKG